MKFSLQTVLALTIVAVLIAAIYGEQRRGKELALDIAESKEWLESFNHYSVECLPYYRKALEYEDPLIPFCKKLVARFEQTRKKIESMPDRSESEVSVIEVATMDFNCYSYAIHVPVGKSAKVEFYIANKRNDPLEKHLVDKDAPFKEPWTLVLSEGLSTLEVIQRSINETPTVKPGTKIVFAKLTPTLKVQFNGKQVFNERIPGFSPVGSNHGWKPDAKKLIVFDNETSHREFATFFLTEMEDNPMSFGIHEPGKNFIIKFRLSSIELADGEQSNEE